MHKPLIRISLTFLLLVELIAFTQVDAAAQSASTTISFQNGVSPSTGYSGGTDAYISESTPTTNYGGSGSLRVDGDDPVGSNQDLSALMRWDISVIPPGSTIEAVSITLQIENGTVQTYSMYPLKRPWAERQVNWGAAQTGMDWDVSGGAGAADRSSIAIGSLAASTVGPYTFSLNSAGIAAVQGWVDDPTSNHGLIVAHTSMADGLAFYSNNNSPASRHPSLNITYRPSATITQIPTAVVSTPSPTATIPAVTTPALISLTFDDGSQSVYANALPILRAQGIPATFFFISSFLTDTWKGQLRDLQSHGWEIGSHTVNHARLSTLTIAQLDDELSQSKQVLEAAGLTVTGFAYPYGSGARDSAIQQRVAQYYSYARSVYLGYNRPALQTYALYAQVQDSSVSLETMKSWVDTAIATNQWLIICMHQVDNTGGTYSISTNDLAELASYIKTKIDSGSIRAVTVRDGYSLYGGNIPTATHTATNTLTATETIAATITLTPTASSTATYMPTATATLTPIATYTEKPDEAPTDIATETSGPATNTFTSTAEPSSTPTPDLINLATATDTDVPSWTEEPTPVETSTLTSTAAATLTEELIPTSTDTLTSIATDTPRPAVSSTVTFTSTYTPTAIPNRAPSLPVLRQPGSGATNVSTAVPLEVQVIDPDGDALNVTFYGRETGAITGKDFSLIVLPDSQNYSTLFPEIFTSQTQWIVNNKSSSNIAFVTHVGDLVNRADSTTEYMRADASMNVLDVGGVSYSVVPGNHDYPLTNYNTYFGVSRFEGKYYYGGHYGIGNENNYALFNAGGIDFILINLEYRPPSVLLDWADSLLKTYSNRQAIVVSHNILNLDNTWSYPAIYTALKDNPNLFLMLCGHMHASSDGAGMRTEIGDYGNMVHILISNYQDFPNGGNGYLRIMRFSPANDKIYVQTYSPYTSGYLTDPGNQFELSYPMPELSDFDNLGTVYNVGSGENASITWTGLSNDRHYEWYALASDGHLQAASDRWNFTTVNTPATSTPEPTATFTTIPTSTFTATPSSTLTYTPTHTATFTFTPTATPTKPLTATSTPTKTSTPSPTYTFTPTSAPASTDLFSPSADVSVRLSAGDSNGFEISSSNAYLNDGRYAQDVNSGTSMSTSCTSSSKDKHLFYNFGASIPGTTITGIVVRIDALANSTTGSPQICVQLSWDGGLSWTSPKSTATLTTSEATYLLGSSTDTWGHAWTKSQLSNTNFRVRLINVAASTSRTFLLDWIAVQVYYR